MENQENQKISLKGRTLLELAAATQRLFMDHPQLADVACLPPR